MQILHLLRLRFWFLFPLVGIVVWFSTDWMSDRILEQSYNPNIKLDTDAHPQVRLTLVSTISSITARLDRDDEMTTVILNITNSSLKELEFEFPVDDFHRIETVLVEEFGLHPQTVEHLIQYPDEQNEHNAK